MSRAFLTLRTIADRETACNWVRQAPVGARLEFKSPRRSLPQNDRFWAMLTDIARQVSHHGVKYPPDIWKVLMMQAWGREVKWLPALDGQGVVPLLFSSSDLSKAEMTELMEFMEAWGTQNGVIFGDDRRGHDAPQELNAHAAAEAV
jgi:hypothetical protein